MPDAPSIPRFWWLKRLVALFVVVVVGLVGFHWWLTRHFEAKVERIVQSWRDDGGPMPADVAKNTGVAVGEDNAAFHLSQAMAGLTNLTQRERDLWYNHVGELMPVPTSRIDVVRGIVERDEPALAMVREARDADRVDWGYKALDMTVFMSPNLNGMRDLANRQSWALGVAHYQGEIDQALRYGEDVIVLAEATPYNGPGIIAGLVASGIHALAADRLVKLVWHRPPGMTPEQERAAWQTARADVEAIIERLLDEQQDAKRLELSWRGERVITHSVLDTFGGGLLLPSNVLTRPLMTANIAELLEMQSEAAQVRSWADRGNDAWDPAARADTFAEGLATATQSMLGMSTDRVFASYFRSIAQRRMTAVILAAKLFEADHGRLPKSLDELVPDYLPKAPIDPFDPEGHPLRMAEKQGLTVVYSVGEDGESRGAI